MAPASGAIKFVSRSKVREARATSLAAAPYAIAEINAYIAIRDELLAEAEQLKTHAKLDTVMVANDFIQGCLKPACAPYESQCLPKADAMRERTRCEMVRQRIAGLRAAIV